MRSKKIEGRASDEGFTLIELLIAIVVVGILASVAIVGINGLTNNGNNASCQASIDASRAAVAVHYANQNGVYPTGFDQMITANELVLAGGVTNPTAATIARGASWTITLGAGGLLTSSLPATVCK